MWHIFNFKQVNTGDLPNIQICYEWEKDWNHLIQVNDKIIEITDNFARNLMFILDSEQVCTFADWHKGVINRWRFDDCHSFAFALATWGSLLFPDIPDKKDLEKFWLTYLWVYIDLHEKKILKQWDFLTSWKYLHPELPFINQHAHSFIYLWNAQNQDLFINCCGCEWYINRNWEWIREFTEEVFENFFNARNWKVYINEWYRTGWRLSINTLDEIFASYYNIWAIHVYRKID